MNLIYFKIRQHLLFICFICIIECYGQYWSFQSRLIVPDATTDNSQSFGSTPYGFGGRGFEFIISGYNKYDNGIYIHTQDDGYASKGVMVWTQQAKLVPAPNPQGASKADPTIIGDQFGYWLVSFNQTIIVSSPTIDTFK